MVKEMASILSSNESLYVDSWLRRISDAAQTYALYGTGQITQSILSLIADRQLQPPVFILDHAANVSDYCGHSVLAPTAENVNAVDWVMLGSNTFHESTRTQLVECGTAEGKILDFSYIRRRERGSQQWEMNKELEEVLGMLHNIGRSYNRIACCGTNAGMMRVLEAAQLCGVRMPDCIIRHSASDAVCGVPVAVEVPQDVEAIWFYGDPHFVLQDRMALRAHVPEGADLLDLNDQRVRDTFRFDPLKTTRLPFLFNKILYLGTTLRCNLNCSYCCSPELRKKRNRAADLKPQDAARILDGLRGRVSYLTLVDYGEPLMQRELEAIIGAGVNAGIPIVDTVTNGTLLTEERAHSLALAGLHHIHVSIDSLDPEYNRSVRGVDIDQVLQNTINFSRYTGLGVCINTVVTERNLGILPELPLLRERIPSMFAMSLLPETPEAPEALARPRLLDREKLHEAIALTRRNAERMGVYLDVPASLEAFNSRRGLRDCARPWNYIYIDYTGTMRPCNSSYDNRLLPSINVLEHPEQIPELFNSDVFTASRARRLAGDLPEVCMHCML